MRVGYLECQSGASGDMLLGALVDAGWPEDDLRQVVSALGVPVVVQVERVRRRGVPALRVEVRDEDPGSDRTYPELARIVARSPVDPAIRSRAEAVLRRLAEAEAEVHGVAVDEVRFHELGGLDTVVDVCGALAGLHALGLRQVVASPVNLGRGWASTRHGVVPVPAPATALLARGMPVYAGDVEAELLTPTGAALLAEVVSSWGPLPPMRLERVGTGAGQLDLPPANVLRLFLGEPLSEEEGDPRSCRVERLVVLEASLDDMTPQLYPYVAERLLEAGALDVTTLPAVMKKGRPGHLLRVLAAPDRALRLIALLLRETTTLGVRQYEVTRTALARRTVEVDTEFGRVPVKVAWDAGGVVSASPEFEACRALAERHHVPLRRVLDAARRAAAAWEDRAREDQ